LQAVNVEKGFHHGGIYNPVLKSVNMNIERGELISIMGPSGSGKSTLLYSISGLDRIDRGSVRFGEENLQDLNGKELSRLRLHKMGFVFQQIHLLGNLGIYDNILASAYLAGKKPRSEIRRQARDLMRLTGIGDLEKRSISQASGGQLQRAGICRALINDPEILFGDEPTGSLDSRSAHEIMDLLSDLNDRGMTILLVTHDLKVAARTDRVLYMRDGRITGEYRSPDRGDRASLAEEREKQLQNWINGIGE